MLHIKMVQRLTGKNIVGLGLEMEKDFSNEARGTKEQGHPSIFYDISIHLVLLQAILKMCHFFYLFFFLF